MRVLGLVVLVGCGSSSSGVDAFQASNTMCGDPPAGAMVCADFDSPATGLAEFATATNGGMLQQQDGTLVAAVDFGSAWASHTLAGRPSSVTVSWLYHMSPGPTLCQELENSMYFAPVLVQVDLPALGRSVQVVWKGQSTSPGMTQAYLDVGSGAADVSGGALAIQETSIAVSDAPAVVKLGVEAHGIGCVVEFDNFVVTRETAVR